MLDAVEAEAPIWLTCVLFVLGVVLYTFLKDLVLHIVRPGIRFLRAHMPYPVGEDATDRLQVSIAAEKLHDKNRLGRRWHAVDDLAQYWQREDAFETLCEAVADRRQNMAIRLHAINKLEEIKPLRRALILGNNPPPVVPQADVDDP